MTKVISFISNPHEKPFKNIARRSYKACKMKCCMMSRQSRLNLITVELQDQNNDLGKYNRVGM